MENEFFVREEDTTGRNFWLVFFFIQIGKHLLYFIAYIQENEHLGRKEGNNNNKADIRPDIKLVKRPRTDD